MTRKLFFYDAQEVEVIRRLLPYDMQYVDSFYFSFKSVEQSPDQTATVCIKKGVLCTRETCKTV